MLPLELNRLILRFHGTKIPIETLERMDGNALFHWDSVNHTIKRAWGPWGWSRTNCNRLIIAQRFNPVRGKHQLAFCRYLACTGLTPTMKKAIKEARSGKFVPVWPGDRHYPTSRVGFYPKYHINDRYFR